MITTTSDKCYAVLFTNGRLIFEVHDISESSIKDMNRFYNLNGMDATAVPHDIDITEFTKNLFKR